MDKQEEADKTNASNKPVEGIKPEEVGSPNINDIPLDGAKAEDVDNDGASEQSKEGVNANNGDKTEETVKTDNVVKPEEGVQPKEQVSAEQTVEKTPQPICREERLRRIREEHLRETQAQVEEAKNPASYETYDCAVSQADERIRLFTARRKGSSHVKGGTPCQDYCLATSVNGCTVLADADGVGSCEHSDIGSKLACEAVVLAAKAATESCDEEEEIVRRLLTVSFRDRLVDFWKKGVFEEMGKAGDLSSENRQKEFTKYSSTVMFAILTKNWIVVGNLGDGQVLVFNDQCGVKLRVHGLKRDTKTRCLTDFRCVREDFLVAKYPRNAFNGVLLSTDGIYDSFPQGNIFYDFCIQAKNRFLGSTPCEPYQAFCYQEKDEPYKDFSREPRTYDDCSIAMAVDKGNVECDYETAIASILHHVRAVMLERWRWSPECLSFSIADTIISSDIVASRKTSDFALPDKLKSAILESPIEIWEEGGLLFSQYDNANLPTIELMRCDGMLRWNRHNPTESKQTILKIYLQIRSLQKELSEHGLALNSSALFNITYDGKVLHIRKEAIKRAESDNAKNIFDGIAGWFSHLLGILESGDTQSPLFYIDLDSGYKLYRFADSPEELAGLVRKDRKTQIKNISPYTWRFDDGKLLPTGESIELARKMTFTLLGNQAEELETYNYVSKELL